MWDKKLYAKYEKKRTKVSYKRVPNLAEIKSRLIFSRSKPMSHHLQNNFAALKKSEKKVNKKEKILERNNWINAFTKQMNKDNKW